MCVCACVCNPRKSCRFVWQISSIHFTKHVEHRFCVTNRQEKAQDELKSDTKTNHFGTETQGVPSLLSGTTRKGMHLHILFLYEIHFLALFSFFIYFSLQVVKITLVNEWMGIPSTEVSETSEDPSIESKAVATEPQPLTGSEETGVDCPSEIDNSQVQEESDVKDNQPR